MANDPRNGDFGAARVGAATALTAVVVATLLAEVCMPGYHVDPVVLVSLLGTIAALLGIEAVDVIRGRR